MLVIKIGGSLYDLPDLGQRLRSFLASLGEADLLIVPGGGPTANVIRDFDHDHHLGAESTHWLSFRACALNAHFLAALVNNAPVISEPRECRGLAILDPFAFALADEGQPGCLPHHHDATSDSVAARAALLAHADLVLLKSGCLPREMTWPEAATAGFVDPIFPGIAAAILDNGRTVRAVNLREALGIRN